MFLRRSGQQKERTTEGEDNGRSGQQEWRTAGIAAGGVVATKQGSITFKREFFNKKCRFYLKMSSLKGSFLI